MSPSRRRRPDAEPPAGRWQRREARKEAERARMQKHGASLRRIYRDASLKRARSTKKQP